MAGNKEKEFFKKTVRFGNSAGVLLPRDLLGSEVKITIISKPIDIKKEVMKLLMPYFEDIIGIYVISPTKQEQENQENEIENENKLEKIPIEVLAVSTKIRKTINYGKIKLNIVPSYMIKRDIKTSKELRKKISQAKPILNKAFLLELKK